MAEREGFEPPEPFGSTVFKTAAFGHSATSPMMQLQATSYKLQFLVSIDATRLAPPLYSAHPWAPPLRGHYHIRGNVQFRSRRNCRPLSHLSINAATSNKL